MINLGKSIVQGIYSLGKGLYSIGEGLSNIVGVNPIEILSEQESCQKDYDAIKSDWEIVGKDLEKAINNFKVR